MEILARSDLLSLVVHIAGTALFAAVFLFIYRESRTVYFGYWALAWGLLSAGLLFHLAAVAIGRPLWLVPYSLLSLAFTFSIAFAAASATGKFEIQISRWAALLPLVAVAGYASRLLADFNSFYALNCLLLMAAYGWNFMAFRRRARSGKGSGRKLFSASLFASSILYGLYSLSYGAVRTTRPSPGPSHLAYHDFCDLILETLLAFSAMMMWMESQNTELAQSRLELALNARLDPLTGLLNRAALEETCEAGEAISGVVAVADLDNFKDVNDALGHLAGDEVLANVGNLIKSSIRKDDLAWRWGGDEFVVLFRNQSKETAEERMHSLGERLLRFRIRGKGVFPVRLSWGAIELRDRPLREALEAADHEMYLRKRDKTSTPKLF
ncbi:MAG: GGDEF domain-containing protein [Acidobacteria bacterium]|nr:GGDEF domain-containing protein [Acidobacteriota bacterium]